GNMPHRITHGAAVSFLKRRADREMPARVDLGAELSIGGGPLGRSAGPPEIVGPGHVGGALGEFNLAHGLNPDRLDDRQGLLKNIDGLRRLAEASFAVRSQDAAYQRALGILTSTRVRDAFDLAREPEARRDRYGANSFGQSCLLARRLIEAGTRFV